ncbi:protoporphyrinogen oxidase HemJ [Methyloferula stellata]|uniref:protoporphyrinogen oxidase HemJ n=1 Tax=Methyloferula stellata TaxID=876270 RepID=UPI00037E9B06|nr:protoporphyrinogen oxidase HemJ [Methyloferula stellata]
MDVVYSWIKILHIVSLISWMVGLFYLPRLFVYHAEAGAASPQAETFKVMELRLQRIIMLPAMLATWASGLYLAINGGFFESSGWIYAKLLLVLGLSGLHGFLGKTRKDFAMGYIGHSPEFYRVINEIPTLLLIFIVILVVLKPF